MNAIDLVMEYNNIDDDFTVATIVEKAETIESIRSLYEIDDIRDLIDSAKRIIIHADYDADGITSAAIASMFLPCDTIYVPEREDGYGVSQDFVDTLKEGDLLITADCGINSGGILDNLPDGVNYIVTDHHTPKQGRTPSGIVINPLLNDDMFHGYSGSAVIWLVLSDLFGENDYATQCATIGTICDVMPMIGPNRSLVRSGLNLINKKPYPPILELSKKVRVHGSIDEEDIGWKLGPAINAAGRMGNVNAALDWMCNQGDTKSLADSLVKYNELRKKETRRVSTEEIMQEQYIGDMNAVFRVKTEYPGVLGLAASSLSRTLGKTVFVVSGDDMLVGSARSQNGNCFSALAGVSDILVSFGGHSGAAGFSLKSEDFPAFCQRMMDARHKDQGHQKDTKKKPVEVFSVSDAVDLLDDINKLAPFGNQFERPMFSTIAVAESVDSLGKTGEHTQFYVQGIRCLAFGVPCDTISTGDWVSMIYTPKTNQFLGRSETILEVSEVTQK